MNRRQFTTGLTALAAAPALPIGAMTSMPATSAAIPHPARFWAIYMSHLHGSCSPQTLSKIAKIDVNIAHGYLNTLISDGVLTPTRIISKAISVGHAKQNEPSGLRDRLNNFLNEKTKELEKPEEQVNMHDDNEAEQIDTETKP